MCCCTDPCADCATDADRVAHAFTDVDSDSDADRVSFTVPDAVPDSVAVAYVGPDPDAGSGIPVDQPAATG
jgi:hypothetical protein